MRADSIRDRYAKGMALLGLGLLAGTGALVDYWPTRGQMPLVAPFGRVLLAATSHPDPLLIVVPPPAATRRAPAPTSAGPGPVPVLLVSAAPRVGGVPVALVAPRLEPVADPVVEPVAVLASATTVGASLILPPLATPRHTASWSTDSDDGGFLPGAVRRTGASILRTSARAGASVFDAFRSLGGAVKRALPN